MLLFMASRGVVIPFPTHRVRRHAQRASCARAALNAQLDLDEREQAQLRLFGWCFAAAAALTVAIAMIF